jgi:hypothetical protein
VAQAVAGVEAALKRLLMASHKSPAARIARKLLKTLQPFF